jgi:hypothetical protein
VTYPAHSSSNKRKIDGETNAPIDKLLDLHSTEYEAVIKEVNKIQNPSTPEKSEQLGADTTQTA